MSNGNPETKPILARQIQLPSTPDVIHMVEAVVDEIKTELGFKEDVYGNVMVAVTEAVNNSVTHGNQGDESRNIFIDFEMKNQFCLKIRVKDEGSGFDYNSLPDPTAPENIDKLGGRGVFLMTHLSDELTFLDEGRAVEMTFNI